MGAGWGGRARRLAGTLPSWARIAWWGLLAPHGERVPLVVHQAAVLSDAGVLLAVRNELRGWELPGGSAEPGESGEQAVAREVLEETGIEIEAPRLVGEWVRTGFRPHTARIYLARAAGGGLRPSAETPRVDWFPVDAIPDTLFPWYREPLRAALAGGEEVVRRSERQGLASVLAGMAIDLRMRWSGEESP
jgi:ADP-ribose pyrophosphatase YjhB (NUDIX family)